MAQSKPGEEGYVTSDGRYVYPGVSTNAGAPGYNEYGVPLYATNGKRCDKHYWAYLTHVRKQKDLT